MSVEEMPSTQQVQELLPDDTGPSWQSRCINGLLRLLPIKKQTASAAAVQEHVRRLALRPARYEPTGLGRGVEVTLKNVAGWPVYYTAPSANPDIGNYVLFLHGGGYINEIVRAHWRFIGYLTRHARVRCVVPIYPLAPRATAKDVVPATGDLLWKLLEDARPAKVGGRQFGRRRIGAGGSSVVTRFRISATERAGADLARGGWFDRPPGASGGRRP